MTISTEDVRRLLKAEPTAVLVLLEGRTEVISDRERDDDAHRGALEVISRADLIGRTGSEELSDHELEEQAAALDAAVSELGG
jgi:NADH:quinone reductase (non-electrogenic)